MAIGDVLKGLRSQSYGESESDDDEKSSERVLELSEDEQASLGEGQDVTVQVTGRFENGCIYVSSVKGPGGEPDVNADAEAVMAKMRPTQMQTVPSPS